MWNGFSFLNSFYPAFSSTPSTVGPLTVKTISSFDEVFLSRSKPLVLCDIDETLLQYHKRFFDILGEVTDKYDRGMIQHGMSKKLVETLYHRDMKLQYIAKLEYDKYILETPPVPTDREGFNRLLLRLYLLNGELKFLTARGKQSEDFTRKHFTQIGVNYDDFDVHYTDASHKGEYIKKNISLGKYNDIIFIDDLDNFIENVQLHFPQIQCYKFVAKPNSIQSYTNTPLVPMSITR